METIVAIVRPDGTKGWVRRDEGIVQCRDHTHPTEEGAEGCPARLTRLRNRIPFLKKKLRDGLAISWEDSKYLMEVLGDSAELVASYKSRYETLHERSIKAIRRRDDKILDLEKKAEELADPARDEAVRKLAHLEEKVVEFADAASTLEDAHKATRDLLRTRGDKINNLKERVKTLEAVRKEQDEEIRTMRRELHLLRENRHLSTQLDRSRGKAKRLEKEKEKEATAPMPQGQPAANSWDTRMDRNGNEIRGEKAWDL